MPSQQQTLEQKRAAQAWQNVTNALNEARREVETALAAARQRDDRQLIRDLENRLNRLNTQQGGDEFRGKYGTLARKAPALITSMGLGQTLAFLRAKGKNDGWDEHTILSRHISGWVVGQIGKTGDLLDVVRQESSEVYRQATAEALAFLGWLKRFAEAELPEAEGD